MSIASHITAIAAEDWLTLARECTHRALWQVSDCNSSRLFAMAEMFKGLAGQERKRLRTPKRKGTIRSWRAWDE